MTNLSIYIHWPFCKSKCPYCDFNSHVRAGVDHARWRAALLRELGYYAALLPGRRVVSLFFGGGTPSLMEAETVASLIDAADGFWPVADDAEITLEANPTSVEAENFRAFRTAGVNRASLGIQALNAKDLTFLGRQHSAEEAFAALALARDIFPRMSFDMIYALPGQTPAAWEKELTEVLSVAKDHLSLYQLTIEENTAFHHAYHSGAFTLPGEDAAAELYQLTASIMEAQGMPAYEISNYAKAGAESRHNLTYWRGDDYIGIGPGAHGRYRNAAKQRIATETVKSPERWLEKVEQSGTGLISETMLEEREQCEELVMMGLRLREGIEYDDWQKRTGLALRQVLSPRAVETMRKEGLIIADDLHIKTTPRGRLLLNAVTSALLAEETPALLLVK